LELRETLSKKPVKFLTLLLTAILIATASAAVYYGMIMQPSITISAAPVRFVEGNDWPGGTMGDNSTWCSLTFTAYPNVTVVYEKPLNISNTDSDPHDIKLRHVSISPDSGDASVSNFTKIAFILVNYTGSTIDSTFNYTTTYDTWSKPSAVGWYSLPNGKQWIVRVEITTAGSANAVTVNIKIAVDVR